MGAFLSTPQFTPAAPQAQAPLPSYTVQAAPVQAVPVPAISAAVDAYQEPVLRAKAREAATAAALEADMAAMQAEQARADRAARLGAETESGRISGQLAASIKTRDSVLRRDQGSSTASAAARGILSGGTARSLLQGLANEAQTDTEAARLAATQRLDDIRRDLDVRREQNLLALAEEKRRAQLASHNAAVETLFTEREAWSRQVADRQRVLDEQQRERDAYQAKVDAYHRELEAYNRTQTQKAAQQRTDMADTVTQTVLGALMPRLR